MSLVFPYIVGEQLCPECPSEPSSLYKASPIIIAKQSVRETGLSLSTPGDFVLDMGITMAFFPCLGTTPSLYILYGQLKMTVTGELNS